MNLKRTEFGVGVMLPEGEILPIRHIIGIGMNYAAHAIEQGKGVPERPVLFSKNPYACGLSGEEIVIPRVCQDRPQVDFEAELGVIVGRHPSGRFVRDVSESEALACVLGYVTANDVSARWWQKDGAGGQFNRGKSFDSFCPIGPAVVPGATIADPQNLRLTTKVNGEVMQDANTSDMIFPVRTLIAEISRGTTILPGTLILTGTPSGVGFARKPQVFLKQGDVVDIEVEGIGMIRNSVREE
ncbi:MAG: fumarylacetoacetate hydrolase family protein [Phycisphaerales bacterium]|nr:fumarylacetoacetate hydrolase family protein [Phycisphaerales bacterium]